MPEQMNEVEARRWLLRTLQAEVKQSQNAGEEVLDLGTDDFAQYGDTLGWTTSEVSALYKRLVRGGFLRQVNGETEFVESRGVLEYAQVEDLTDDGLREIEVLPNPHERLVESLDAFAETIRASSEASEEEKDQAEKVAGEFKTFVRGLAPAAAVQAARAFAASMGAPLP